MGRVLLVSLSQGRGANFEYCVNKPRQLILLLLPLITWLYLGEIGKKKF